ncbi:MAG: helix-turn-helix domain-containing protein [Oscillospiraceae bacterium]|nr:helix-turn-helix domain-containing protein [Oscillospiraceae bacterium]
MDTIRKFLVDYIDKKGIKQAFIAKSTGMSTNAVSQVLTGKRKIQADEFLKICRAVDMSQETINELIHKLSDNNPDTIADKVIGK